MSEFVAAAADEALRRELAGLTAYQLAERTVAEVGTSGNRLRLPTFELAGGTFHPVISKTDTFDIEPAGTATLEDGIVTLRQGFRRAPSATATYIALWPGAGEAAVYTIGAFADAEDQVSSAPIGEYAKTLLGKDKSFTQVDREGALYARRRYIAEYSLPVFFASGSALDLFLRDDTRVGLQSPMFDVRHPVGMPREAVINMDGNVDVRPLPGGYTKIADNKVLVSDNTDQLVTINTLVSTHAVVPDSTKTMQVAGPARIRAISKYATMPPTEINVKLKTDKPHDHQRVADQLLWRDATTEFFDSRLDQIWRLAQPFDRQQVVTALVQAIEAARSDPSQPIAPTIVGTRAVVQFLAQHLASRSPRLASAIEQAATR